MMRLNFIVNFLNKISNNTHVNKIILFFSVSLILSASYAFYILNINAKHHDYTNPYELGLWISILIALSSFLLTILFIIRKLLYKIFKNYEHSRIRAHIILMFSIVAIIPTIMVSAFSIFIFNIGIQGWFDPNVSKSINNSIKVAELYIQENKLNLRDTSITMANDLNELYYEISHNPVLLSRFLNTQAQMRSLNEAIIFQKSTNTILAQTPLSFSLSFWNIPEESFKKADNGDVIELSNDFGKIIALVKLWEFEDTYLLVAKLIDNEILRYVDETNGAANKYFEVKQIIKDLQVKYSLSFIMFAVLLLGSAIFAGTIFANRIARRIRKLVNATKEVQAGNLNVNIDLKSDKNDEITILTSAFNKMVKKLEIQQKDLALAQRAMAWEDVARRVAHEIKNPLTPISLSADRIKKKFENEIKDKENFNKYIATIQRHAKDIQKIITEFSEFAKIPTPAFQTIEIISKLRDLLESRKILDDNIEYNFDSNVEEYYFKCDSTQFNQIIINLLKNSEEALETVNSAKKISLNVNVTSDEIEITICDNGKGFPRDLIDKVTEAYLTTRSKGTGLGLAIVKKITQDHGGEVLISNTEEGGASVKLIFDTQSPRQKS